MRIFGKKTAKALVARSIKSKGNFYRSNAGVSPKKRISLSAVSSLLKYSAVGGAAGYAASRVSSSAAEAPENAKSGLKTGLAVGAAAVIVPKIVFRRVKGRIIPMRSK